MGGRNYKHVTAQQVNLACDEGRVADVVRCHALQLHVLEGVLSLVQLPRLHATHNLQLSKLEGKY